MQTPITVFVNAFDANVSASRFKKAQDLDPCSYSSFLSALQE